ncbi:uncharacterized protein LOC128883626 [Hylaeus volcanicus]|uniref:uncharacterized protein LOC128883626 n=1 Tax=Hylaeus volcanicus TaxID=313075 RepID=UPI0023B78D02|nr:uncharacterized protein LOC128883626 [Hylaeus volcanicus]
MKNLNFCEKSVLVECWKSLQTIFLEYETSGQISMQFNEDIALLKDYMIHVLETMNSHLTKAKAVFNEKEYLETFQCILDIFVLLEEKSSSFQLLPSRLTVRLGCLLVYVAFNLLKQNNRNEEDLWISNLSFLHPCIEIFPKLLKQILADLELKCYEILQSYSDTKENLDSDTLTSFKILRLISHTPSLHEFMFLLWDYTEAIQNICDMVIEMINDSSVLLCMKEKCHLLCSFLLCLPTFRLRHLPSYKPLEFLLNSSFFIPVHQHATHSFLFYCDNTLQYLLSKITASIIQYVCLTQEDLSCLIDLLCRLLEEVLYLKIPLTITTKDVFHFYQYAVQHASKPMVKKTRRVCSLLLPLITTRFEEWKEEKQLFTLLCQLLEEHLVLHTSPLPSLFTYYTQWTQPLSKMVLFCTTLQDLFITQLPSLTPSLHGPIIAELLFHAWSSLCYHETHTLSYCLAKQFFHWFLHLSIHLTKNMIKERTQLFFLLYVWRLFGRTLEKRTFLFNTCLKYLISYALFTTYNTHLPTLPLPQTDWEWDTVRANIVCYPSRSQTNLMQLVLIPYLSNHTQLDTVLNLFQNVLKRIHFLLKSFFYHTKNDPTRQTLITISQNSLDHVWSQCFSLHHLIAFLHVPLRLLKQYGTVFHFTQAQELVQVFYQYFITLQPPSSNHHDSNNLHQKSMTGHWNQTLVQYDLFCFCLDTFTCYPHIITQKTFTLILNYTGDMLLPRNFTLLTTTLVPWIPRFLASLWSLNNLIRCVPENHSNYPPLVLRCINKSLCLFKTLVECHQDTSCSQCTTIISYIVTWFVVLTYRRGGNTNNNCFTLCDQNQLFLLRKTLNNLKKDTTMERIVTLFCDCIGNTRWQPSLSEQINSLLLNRLQELENMKKRP